MTSVGRALTTPPVDVMPPVDLDRAQNARYRDRCTQSGPQRTVVDDHYLSARNIDGDGSERSIELLDSLGEFLTEPVDNVTLPKQPASTTRRRQAQA